MPITYNGYLAIIIPELEASFSNTGLTTTAASSPPDSAASFPLPLLCSPAASEASAAAFSNRYGQD